MSYDRGRGVSLPHARRPPLIANRHNCPDARGRSTRLSIAMPSGARHAVTLPER